MPKAQELRARFKKKDSEKNEKITQGRRKRERGAILRNDGSKGIEIKIEHRERE